MGYKNYSSNKIIKYKFIWTYQNIDFYAKFCLYFHLFVKHIWMNFIWTIYIFIFISGNAINLLHLDFCQDITAIGYKLFVKCQVTHQLFSLNIINIYFIQSITCYKRGVTHNRSIRPWKCFWNESVALHDRTNGNKHSMLFWDNG